MITKYSHCDKVEKQKVQLYQNNKHYTIPQVLWKGNFYNKAFVFLQQYCEIQL